MPAPKILLIDYDPVTVEFTRTSLTQAGFAVEVAPDGLAGLLAFESLHPDLVVVEAMLPKKHGFEVCQEIKTSDAGRDIPVVITTASYSGRKYRTEALQTYLCDEYLEKPVGKERLLSVCRELLSIMPESLTPVESTPTPMPAPTLAAREEQAELPDLTEMSDDELSARLDSLVHEETEPLPQAADRSVPTVQAEIVGADRIAEASTVTVPQLADVTEADIVDCLDSALVRPARQPEEPVATPAPNVVASVVASAVAKPAIAEKPIEAKPVAEPHRTAVPTRAKATPRKPDAHKSSGTAADIAAKLAVDKPAAPRETPVAPRPAWITWAGLAAGAIVLAAAAGAGWYWTRPTAPTTTAEPAVAPPKRSASIPRATLPAPGRSAASMPDRSTILPVDPSFDPGPIDGLAGRMEQAAAKPRTKPAAAKAATKAATKPATQPAAPVEKTSPPEPAPAVLVEPEAEIVTDSPATSDPVEPPSFPARFEARRLTGDSPESSLLVPVSVTPEPALIVEQPLMPGALIDAAQVDVAPRLLKQTMPEYHPQARMMGQEGVVRLELLVNHEGVVEEVRLVEGIPRSRLNDAALREARSWTYRPAYKDGVPVRTWVAAQIEFQL